MVLTPRDRPNSYAFDLAKFQRLGGRDHQHAPTRIAFYGRCIAPATNFQSDPANFVARVIQIAANCRIDYLRIIDFQVAGLKPARETAEPDHAQYFIDSPDSRTFAGQRREHLDIFP